MTALLFTACAPAATAIPTATVMVDADHFLNGAAQNDRAAWLTDKLDLPPGP